MCVSMCNSELKHNENCVIMRINIYQNEFFYE